MSTTTKQAIDLMELLLESEQKLVLAWDPDFTQLTPAERAELERQEKRLKMMKQFHTKQLIGTDRLEEQPRGFKILSGQLLD